MYKITPYSLYAAVAVSIDASDILHTLSKLAKHILPQEIVEYIETQTMSCGKVKMVLKGNRYFVESSEEDILRTLLRNPTIANARISDEQRMRGDDDENETEEGIISSNIHSLYSKEGFTVLQTDEESNQAHQALLNSMMDEEEEEKDENNQGGGLLNSNKQEGRSNGGGGKGLGGVDVGRMIDRLELLDGDDFDDEVMFGEGDLASSNHKRRSSSSSSSMLDPSNILENPQNKKKKVKKLAFCISQKYFEDVKRVALELDFPLMEEYDFRKDKVNPNLLIELKPTTIIRPYQEKCLNKMFGNGRARSGIVVLPCGAGKTLTGVTAACTIQKSTIVICNNIVAVRQWKEQFELWSTLDSMPHADKVVCMFISGVKEKLPPPNAGCICLTTYHMISFTRQRAEKTQFIMDQIKEREWGIMILDEVHQAPASKFRLVARTVKAHCKLGLTATLVREDDLISDLRYLVGPKLYEANWMDLTRDGFLANVQCVEVWCSMTGPFFREYLRCTVERRRRLLYVMNPNKLRVCHYLVNFHTKRRDKVIVFSDDIAALHLYMAHLGHEYLYGGTSDRDRQDILSRFKNDPTMNCIGLSKVGDVAIDLPDANVIIQVSSHFGARRQEAQRLGRILRPKTNVENSINSFNAFFYTLVSTDTAEMVYSSKRQQYLVDQGYTFKVVRDLVERAMDDPSCPDPFPSRQDELNLLSEVLAVETTRLDQEDNTGLRGMTSGSEGKDLMNEEEEDDDEFKRPSKKTVGRNLSQLSRDFEHGSYYK